MSSVVRGRATPPPRRPPPGGRVTVTMSPPPLGQTILGVLPSENVAIVGSSLANFGEGTSQPQPAPATRILPSPNVNVLTEVASHSAPIDASTPTQKKRKSRKDGDRSSSKKNHREGSASTPSCPLPGGVFSTDFNVGRRVDFHMGSTHRAILDGLSGSALMDAIFEMASRTALMVGYVREFGDHHGSGEVKVALLKEHEKTVALEAELESLWKTHEEAEQRSLKCGRNLSRPLQS